MSERRERAGSKYGKSLGGKLVNGAAGHDFSFNVLSECASCCKRAWVDDDWLCEECAKERAKS